MHTEIIKMAVINMDEIAAEVEVLDSSSAIKIELYQNIHDFESWQELSIKVAECIDKLSEHFYEQFTEDEV